jgi:hypothetical protein
VWRVHLCWGSFFFFFGWTKNKTIYKKNCGIMEHVTDKVFQGAPFPTHTPPPHPHGRKPGLPPPASKHIRPTTSPSFAACLSSASISIGIFWVVLIWIYYLLKARQNVSIHPVLKAGILVSILTTILWVNVYICNTVWMRPTGLLANQHHPFKS